MKSRGHGVGEAGLGDSGYWRGLCPHELIRNDSARSVYDGDARRNSSCGSSNRLVTSETNGSVLRGEGGGWQQRVARRFDVDLSIEQVERFFLQFRPLRKCFLCCFFERRCFNGFRPGGQLRGNNLDVNEIWRQRILADGVL